MPAGVITSERPFVIERDIRCRECRYNLRGLDSAGDCPECGHPIGLSLTDTMDNFLRSLPDEARRNLRIEITFEPDGMWNTSWPLLAGVSVIPVAAALGWHFFASLGLFLGAGAGIAIALSIAHHAIMRSERRAIARYLSRQCIDRRLNRCPLCYRDLTGAMADTCPECGCPVSVRQIA